MNFLRSSVLISILLFVFGANATNYYVESAPTPPFFCTNPATPCPISALPSVGSGDTVTFRAATTGSSDVYSSGTFYKTGVEIIVEPDVIFDDFNLYVRNADATIEAKRFRDTSSFFVIGNNANNIFIDGTHFKHSSIRAVDTFNFTFINGKFSHGSGTDTIDVDTRNALIKDVQIQDSSITNNYIFITTESGTSDYTIDNVDFTDADTTQHLIRVSHENSDDANIDILNVDVSSCVVGGAVFYLNSPSKFGSTTHAIEGRFDDITVASTSVGNGIICSFNDDNGAKINVQGTNVDVDGTDFNNGAVLELTNNDISGTNRVWLSSFSSCTSVDQDFAAICTGTPQPILQGNTDGGTTAPTCLSSFISLGSVC